MLLRTMTVVHTYFYIVVDTQRGCHTLKKFWIYCWWRWST